MRSRPPRRDQRTARQQRPARGERAAQPPAEEPRFPEGSPFQNPARQDPWHQGGPPFQQEPQPPHAGFPDPRFPEQGRPRDAHQEPSPFGEEPEPEGGRRAERGRKSGKDVRPDLRKRRRTPKSDWQFPLLTDWGLRPEQQRLLVIVASVAAGLLATVGLVVLIGSFGNATGDPARVPAAAQAGPGQDRPARFEGWASPKLFAPIADRAKDAKPLSQKELFAAKSLTRDKKLSLKLVASEVAAECAPVLWGRQLIEQVTAAGCSQAARGLYASADRRYVAQYTLLNLRDAAAADALVSSLKALYLAGWVQPLPSEKAAFPHRAHTEGGAYALGHYVGIVWVARADGAEPGPKDDFVSLALTLRDAEKALYRRVVAITGPGSG
ncbi:hypothetical protein [Nonomuraea sp. NPDC050310]|uniref:hypothetical protein n=1 Tax=unclassified Nonomuraea TaxID=2593643 RepID=UPI0033FD953D